MTADQRQIEDATIRKERRETAAAIRDAADRLELAFSRESSNRGMEICSELKSMAAGLEHWPNSRLPTVVKRLAQLCAEIAEVKAPRPQDVQSRHPAHNPPHGPGGLGYIMTLSQEEKRVITSDRASGKRGGQSTGR